MGYHNHDHAADFGGVLLGARDGLLRCCYVDVKITQALALTAQRTKLEQRAKERKLGLMAQTLTTAANNGYAGYPGRGTPGLIVTLLHNPVSPQRKQAGFSVNWFFGIASNYQATAARWGWGGPLGVRLPLELTQQLQRQQVSIRGSTLSWLELLQQYRDYGQFRGEAGAWDREMLQATLQAKHFAGRFLLMNEDVIAHAQSSVDNLQPDRVRTPLRLEEFPPGESLAAYYGRKADEAFDRGNAAEDQKRLAEDQKRHAEARERQSVERRRQRGHQDVEIAEDLGYSLADFHRLYPPQA